MPLLIPTYTTLLMNKMSSLSYEGHAFNGPMLLPFCTAVATGVTQTVLTLQGQVVAPALLGPSTGAGIVVSGSMISQLMLNKAKQLFNGEGPVLQKICDAIGETTQMYFMMATLISDTNGPVLFPRFINTIQIMKSNIINAAPNFKGEKWPDFAEAIATGICQATGSNGTGVVAGAVIPGTGSGIVFIM